MSRDGGAGNLARAGVIHTPHGDIHTPAFIPVGTKATVKGVIPEVMANLGKDNETNESFGAQAVLANAYHLRLRPGPDILDEAGGLATFMNWKIDGKYAPTFTDSGGFQVMSLGVGFKKVVPMSEVEAAKALGDAGQIKPRNKLSDNLAKIDNDGVTFKSHLDGALLRFNPEISLEIQHKIGADIMFAFDELTTLLDDYNYQVESLNVRTHPWAVRSLEEHYRQTNLRSDKPYQALYAVLQGAKYEDLRRQTANYLANLEVNGIGFDGFGIGGAFEKENLGQIIGWCCDELNNSGAECRPRHILGISGVTDLFTGIENGADTFDCVSPSREGRNGAVYITNKRINIKNAKYISDFTPIDDSCGCYTCANYTRAYLNHLIRSGEMLGGILCTIHNEFFILKLVDDIRLSIINGNYQEFKQSFFASE